MKILLRQLTATALAALLACPAPILLGQTTPTSRDDEDDEVIVLSPFTVSAGSGAGYVATATLAGARLGATAGGAQDINYFRSGAKRGEVPHPNSITAEGLFSEHDLPLDLGATSEHLFVVQSAAIPAQFPVLPEITHLAQLGFSSGLAAATWKRAPLNLVAVVDKSGSMSGHPLALVRRSLHEVLRQLDDGDQLSIVLYGDRSHVHLPATPVSAETRAQIQRGIDTIESSGSTNMEQGLAVAYQLARETQRHFEGDSRVMLFTDERPNVGNTSAAGFMGMADAAARDGIGLTTIGVGVQFGTELANRIAGVRGGNLFFFPDDAEMIKTFTEDFDTMVTELARDFQVRIAPARGFRIAGVFGVPSNLLRWDGDAIVLDVATIFLSKRKGGIYFALQHENERARSYLPATPARPGDTLARIAFSYTDTASREKISLQSSVNLTEIRDAQLGLSRGIALVDEFLTLRRAASAHLFDNDQETAWQLTRDLKRRLDLAADDALEPERQLVANVLDTFAFLSGHSGDSATDSHASLTGTWLIEDTDKHTEDFFIFHEDGLIENIRVDLRAADYTRDHVFQSEGNIPNRPAGKITAKELESGDSYRLSYRFAKNSLRLTVTPDGARPREFRLHRVAASMLTSRIEAIDTEEVSLLVPRSVDQLTGLPARG